MEVKNLDVLVWEKQIIKNFNFGFNSWKTYAILWKNGSWKSSIAWVIAWNPKYEIISWNIGLEWEIINEFDAYDRAKMWIFLAFQNTPEIPGLNMWEYLREIYNSYLETRWWQLKKISPFIFKRHIKKFLDEVWLSETILSRDLNVWFSWWEKRKIELLQLKLLEPKIIILDEIDSWLDFDALKTASENIKKIDLEDKILIIITHNFEFIKSFNVDNVLIMQDWEIKQSWWAEIIDEIKEKWYNDLLS